jgi:hypothetical protein
MQKAALEKEKASLSDGISAALADVEKGIYAFLAGLILALAVLIGGLFAAITSAATIFGLPAAPVIAAIAVGGACASMIVDAAILGWSAADDRAEEILRTYLYQGRAVAYCCAYVDLRPIGARPFTGQPDLWAHLPARDYWAHTS